MNTLAHDIPLHGGDAAAAADEHHHVPQGWRRWVFATNHKDIGSLYLLFSLTMFMVGGLLAMLIRAELFQPGLVAGSLFAMFAGFYYWSPKWSGVMYVERRGKIHFWVSLVSFNFTFFPMHFLGLAGMPRRYADYPMQFADFNMIASLGGFAFGLAQLYFVLWIVLPVMRKRGEPAPQRPWDGAEGLEWEVPSPAPFHTFETPPKVDASATRIVA